MKSVSPDIRFHFQKPITLRDRRKLKTFIAGLLGKHSKEFASINIIFCSDNYLLDINRRYLQHNYYTDIITFNLAQREEPIAGELYISVDRVKANALSAGVSISNELLRVVFHGILHLCGFKDKTSAQIAEIRTHEEKALKSFKRFTWKQ